MVYPRLLLPLLLLTALLVAAWACRTEVIASGPTSYYLHDRFTGGIEWCWVRDNASGCQKVSQKAQ